MTEPYIEKLLALSTAHMPESDPYLGDARHMEHEYGYGIFVTEPNEGTPDWLVPAMKMAYDNECTLILFDRDCNEDTTLPTWDW